MRKDGRRSIARNTKPRMAERLRFLNPTMRVGEIPLFEKTTHSVRVFARKNECPRHVDSIDR